MKLRMANGKTVDNVAGSLRIREDPEAGEGRILISARVKRADGEWINVLLRPETDSLKEWASDKEDPEEAVRIARSWATIKNVSLDGERVDWGIILPLLERAADDGKSFLIRGKLDATYDVKTREICFEKWASTVSLDVWNNSKDAARANYKARRRPTMLNEDSIPKPADKAVPTKA